jgi:hypothetical protein
LEDNLDWEVPEGGHSSFKKESYQLDIKRIYRETNKRNLKLMTYYINYIKDILGNNYLGVNIPNGSIQLLLMN